MEIFLRFIGHHYRSTRSTAGASRLKESLFGAFEEIVEYFQELLRFFNVWHVRAVLKDDPLRSRNPALNGFHNSRGSLIIAARQEQHLLSNLTEAIHDAPVLNRPYTMNLAGPVHRVIDLRILVHLCEAAIDAIGPYIKPAEVSSIKDHHGFLVRRIAGRAR